MKKFLFGLITLMAINTNATCIEGNQKLEIQITSATFDASYDSEEESLSPGDKAIFEIDGEITEFDIGSFTNDGAGNFGIKAISSEKATYIEVDHDHEAWQDGLIGYVTLEDNRIIDLNSFKTCSFDDLFTIK